MLISINLYFFRCFLFSSLQGLNFVNLTCSLYFGLHVGGFYFYFFPFLVSYFILSEGVRRNFLIWTNGNP